MEKAIEKLIEQFEKTKQELIAQRSAWQDVMVMASRWNDAKVYEVAKRNYDLMHDRIMDFCARAEITKTQLRG